jgi:peptidoglycan DL-endopeptidase CwlO
MSVMVPEANVPIITGVGAQVASPTTGATSSTTSTAASSSIGTGIVGGSATDNYISAFTSSTTAGNAATSSSTSTSASTSDAMPGGSLSALPGGTSVTGDSSVAPEAQPITQPATSSLAQNTSTKNVVIGAAVVLVVIVGGYYLIRSKLDIVRDVVDIGDHVKAHL